MIVNLKESADFLSKYHRIVLELYHRSEGSMTETELYQTVEQVKAEILTEDTSWIVKRLLSLKIVVRPSDDEDRFELAAALRQWVDFLYEHAEPVSEDSIQAHHLQLRRLIQDLREAFQASDRVIGRQIVQELMTLFRRFTADIEITHTAVLKEALEVKNARDRLATHEKFVRINRLYHNYVEPIRRIVSIHGEMEATFDELESLTLRRGSAAFFRDPTIPDQILGRVDRARQTARLKLEECAREVEPLFRRLRRETQILTGASRALTSIHRHGFGASGLAARFKLVGFRIHSQYNDELMRHLLQQLLATAPAVAPSLDAAPGALDEEERRAAAFLKAANEEIAAILPVDDLLGHLHERYPDENWRNVMEAFSDLVLNPDLRATFDPPHSKRRTYRFEEAVIQANPAKLEKPVIDA